MSEIMVVIYGTSWCYDCRRAKRIFDQCQVPYRWIDIDRDPEATRFVKEVNHGMRSVPTIIFPDGAILVEPSDQQLTEKIQLLPV